VGNAVIENILGRALAAKDAPVRVNVEPAGPGRSREIVFRVSPPLATNMQRERGRRLTGAPR
jgi:hypothetical protein